METEELVQRVAQALYDKKAFNLVAIDVRGVSSMTDFFLVAEGNVEKHVQALARLSKEIIEEGGGSIAHTEGFEVGDWVVVDGWQIVVHLFTPATRERYQIDQIWTEAKVLDLELSNSKLPAV